MTDKRTLLRVAAVIGFVLAVLGESTVVVRFLRTGTLDWSVAVKGLLLAGAALGAWTRSGTGSTDSATGT